MTIEIVSVKCGGKGPELPEEFPIRFFDNTRNEQTPCQAYQELLETSTTDQIVYLHDDVTVHDPEWLKKIAVIFGENPDCVAVGLGGATGLGNEDLYRKPFNIWNLARTGYASNQTDWEVHGGHETGICQVAVLDAFCMAVRVAWLRQIKGWPTRNLTHHCLDLWLACEAARTKRETWIVGASVTHHGGGSSTAPVYAEASWLQGGDMASDHQAPHRWLWDEYRDVLPLRLPEVQ